MNTNYNLVLYIFLHIINNNIGKPGLRPSRAQGPIHGCGPPSMKTIFENYNSIK